MATLNKSGLVYLICAITLLLGGCAANPKAETWKTPKKEDAQMGMLIGRLDITHDKKENPDNHRLLLLSVDFKDADPGFFSDGIQKSYVMDNHYFVIPNVKPGKYYLWGFQAGNAYNNVFGPDPKPEQLVEVKPGEIRFVGSIDYIENHRSVWEHIKNTGTFDLRLAQHPTELELLQWLAKASVGSGWEDDIQKRMKQVGR